jgi:hypothetical protein
MIVVRKSSNCSLISDCSFAYEEAISDLNSVDCFCIASSIRATLFLNRSTSTADGPSRAIASSPYFPC